MYVVLYAEMFVSINIILLVFFFQLGLQRSRHLWWWWTWDSKTNLHSIVNEPLQTRQCTNHNDTWNKTVPHSKEAQVLRHGKCGGTLRLVKFWHNHIRWMWYNRTENAGNVTSSKCDNQLFAFTTFSSWFRNDIPEEKTKLS